MVNEDRTSFVRSLINGTELSGCPTNSICGDHKDVPMLDCDVRAEGVCVVSDCAPFLSIERLSVVIYWFVGGPACASGILPRKIHDM